MSEIRLEYLERLVVSLQADLNESRRLHAACETREAALGEALRSLDRYSCDTEYDETADGDMCGYGHMEGDNKGEWVRYDDIVLTINGLWAMPTKDYTCPKCGVVMPCQAHAEPPRR